MSIPVVKFNKLDRPEFFKVLHNRVNQHFKDNLRSKHANFNMKFKTVFMLSLYAVPLALMLTGVVSSLWPVLLMWFLMGFGMSGIGLAVMHDANHGSYSSNPNVNFALGFVLNFIGGFHTNWIIQHNVLHHSYTNVHGFDEDIDKGVMRFSPDQEHKNFFRYQIFYAPFLYGLMTIYWLLVKDFQLLFRYEKKDLLKGQGLTFKKALFQVVVNKVGYVLLTLVMPLLLIDLPWWQILLGFLMMHLICGWILAFVFQPAHVLEDVSFYKTDDKGSVENNWAIHQLKTTSNFASTRALSWFVGGLNYQIEHHLFPNICHVHYRNISGIVKDTAAEYDVPYHQQKTFFAAIKSHFILLDKLGKNQYGKALEKA